MSAEDPPLDTLFEPILQGRLQWPDDGALFLRARAGRPLQEHALPGLVCEQTFKPHADALLRAGRQVLTVERSQYPLVLMLPPRQRDEARALMARAVVAARAGGRVLASVSNTEGARSSESDLARIAGAVETISRNKCRAFWTAPLHGAAAPVLAEQWRELDAVRPIGDGRFVSRPGIFAWDRIDPASALLAAQLPADLSGRAADLGAGFGFLSAELLSRCPRVTALDLYEAEARALDLARRNLADYEARATLSYHWSDVTAGLARRYDVIVTNPPFHTHSSADRPDIGRRFVEVAAEALNPRGRLWLVANRHLPYEGVLRRSFDEMRIVAQRGGFKIVEAIKAHSRSPAPSQ